MDHRTTTDADSPKTPVALLLAGLLLGLGPLPGAQAEAQENTGTGEDGVAETTEEARPDEDHLVEPGVFPGVRIADLDLTAEQRRTLGLLTDSLHDRFGDLLHGADDEGRIPMTRPGPVEEETRVADALAVYREKVLEVLTPPQRERVVAARQKSLLARSALTRGPFRMNAADEYGIMSLFGPSGTATQPFDDRPWERSFPVPAYSPGALSGPPLSDADNLEFFTGRLLLGGKGSAEKSEPPPREEGR